MRSRKDACFQSVIPIRSIFASLSLVTHAALIFWRCEARFFKIANAASVSAPSSSNETTMAGFPATTSLRPATTPVEMNQLVYHVDSQIAISTNATAAPIFKNLFFKNVHPSIFIDQRAVGCVISRTIRIVVLPRCNDWPPFSRYLTGTASGPTTGPNPDPKSPYPPSTPITNHPILKINLAANPLRLATLHTTVTSPVNQNLPACRSAPQTLPIP